MSDNKLKFIPFRQRSPVPDKKPLWNLLCDKTFTFLMILGSFIIYMSNKYES